jgi:hypothetical protein
MYEKEGFAESARKTGVPKGCTKRRDLQSIHIRG